MVQVVNLNQKILKFPLKYRTLMLVSSITFIVIGVLLILIAKWQVVLAFLVAESDNYWQVGLVFLVVALLVLILFIIFSLWKVEIKEDGFVYRNCFGRKRSYNFVDLEIREQPRRFEWSFYKEGKKIISLESIIKDNEALKEAYYKFLKNNRGKT